MKVSEPFIYLFGTLLGFATLGIVLWAIFNGGFEDTFGQISIGGIIFFSIIGLCFLHEAWKHK